MTDPSGTTDVKWDALASPFQSISAAIESAGQATAATTRIIFGCFSCFRKKESPASDGAWFDSEQFQIDHPFCYDNPAIANPVGETTGGSSSSSPRKKLLQDVDVDFKPRDEIPMVIQMKEVVREDDAVGRPVDQKSPKSSRLKFPKRKQRSVQNSTFVSKLEADRCLSYRNEARTRSNPIHHKPSIRSPILQRKTIPPINIDLAESFPFWEDDDSEDEKDFHDFFGDVWKPSELKEVFEFYNDFAFQSFSQPSLDTSTSLRKTKDKFDDVFPAIGEKLLDKRDLGVNSDKINNNSIKVTNKSFNQSATDIADPTTQNWSLKNDDKRTFGAKDDGCELNVKELNSFIKICIFVRDLEELGEYTDDMKETKFFGDSLFTFEGRQLSKTLLFNLVKQTMDHYLIEYKSSLDLSPEYPVKDIQKKVVDVFRSGVADREELASEDFLAVRRRLRMGGGSFSYPQGRYDPDEKIVVRVVSEEIKNEHLAWLNFEEEENQTKLNVAEEIFDHLLREELKVIQMVVERKRTSSYLL